MKTLFENGQEVYYIHKNNEFEAYIQKLTIESAEIFQEQLSQITFKNVIQYRFKEIDEPHSEQYLCATLEYAIEKIKEYFEV